MNGMLREPPSDPDQLRTITVTSGCYPITYPKRSRRSILVLFRDLAYTTHQWWNGYEVF